MGTALNVPCSVLRALSSQQLTLASVMVVDTPGLRNPRHSAEDRGASWSELCHNYLQERLLEHYHAHTFTHTLERYAQVTQQELLFSETHLHGNMLGVSVCVCVLQEKIPVVFQCPESSPAEVVCAVDQPPPQVRIT